MLTWIQSKGRTFPSQESWFLLLGFLLRCMSESWNPCVPHVTLNKFKNKFLPFVFRRIPRPCVQIHYFTLEAWCTNICARIGLSFPGCWHHFCSGPEPPFYLPTFLHGSEAQSRLGMQINHHFCWLLTPDWLWASQRYSQLACLPIVR